VWYASNIPPDTARHHTVDSKTLYLSSVFVWCIPHTSSVVLIFSQKEERFGWNVFPAIAEWYFLPPDDLVLAFNIRELLETRFHQIAPEFQLIDFLSGAMSLNYHCIQKSSEWLLLPFAYTSFLRSTFAAAGASSRFPHPLIVMNYTQAFLFHILCSCCPW
jgi:hypothetical protein